MKTMTTLLATAALITGIAAANAQGTTRQMDEQAGGNSGAVERNPDGSTGGSKSNPSPTTRVQHSNVTLAAPALSNARVQASAVAPLV